MWILNHRPRITWALAAAVLAVAAIGLAGVGFATQNPTKVTAVRIGEHPGMTRFVLELTDNVDYRVFMLADPDRVVIDLPEVIWEATPLKEGTYIGIIKGYRYGLFSPGTFRVVLDIGTPVQVQSSRILEPQEGHGPRLILDLAASTPEAFMAEVKKAAPPAAAAPASPQVSPQAAPLEVTPALGPAPAQKPTTQAFAPPPSPEAKPGKKVVVLDPGHGGVDPGAEGRTGVYEKYLTLSMATELKRQLDATGRYQVVLTRDKDIFIPLRERIAIARAAGADLFISLHADTIDNSHIRGLSVYTLSETASDKEAAALAASENKADVIAGVNLSNESPEVTNILIDLAQRETMNRSANFAEYAVGELSHDAKLLGKTHRFAGFAVLKAPDVPSVLVELGYLSHPEEERQLREPAYRIKVAGALVKSIDRFFGWKDAVSKS